MFLVLCLASFLSLSTAQRRPQWMDLVETGHINTIIGGDTQGGSADSFRGARKKTPWYATVTIPDNARALCGGAIVDSSTVLTAAHCVLGSRMAGIEITNHRDIAALYSGEGVVHIHPKYAVTRSAEFDLAIIKLRRPMSLDGIYIAAIPLGRAPRLNQVGLFAGHGTVDPNSEVASPILKTVNNPVSPCTKTEAYQNNPLVFCTAGIHVRHVSQSTSERGNTCRGDSGGGIVFDGRLAGILSVGNRDCGDQTTNSDNVDEAVYVSVDQQRPFIDQYRESNNVTPPRVQQRRPWSSVPRQEQDSISRITRFTTMRAQRDDSWFTLARRFYPNDPVGGTRRLQQMNPSLAGRRIVQGDTVRVPEA